MLSVFTKWNQNANVLMYLHLNIVPNFVNIRIYFAYVSWFCSDMLQIGYLVRIYDFMKFMNLWRYVKWNPAFAEKCKISLSITYSMKYKRNYKMQVPEKLSIGLGTTNSESPKTKKSFKLLLLFLNKMTKMFR